MPQSLENLAINTIRMLSADAVEKANSGHPGLPMGAAPMAYALWTRFLRHNPRNPDWLGRDRFVLSAGHGSMLLYSLLHLTGYDVSIEDLKNFRQWGSKTPGHPEYGDTPGVETTTGPLGQGFATGVGMALAQRFLHERYDKNSGAVSGNLFDYNIYGIVSDGDLMEGVSNEAASFAGSVGLGNLVYLYDSNDISIEGSTELSFTEDVGKRFEGLHWDVQRVEDGNDVEAVNAALENARAEKSKPSLIIVRTQIGFGAPTKAGTAEVHGAALGADELRATKENLGWPLEPDFFVPDEVREHFATAIENGAKLEEEWKTKFAEYQKAQPELAAEIELLSSGKLPDGWQDALPVFKAEDGNMATRKASGTVINAIAPLLPTLIGGSADLAPSNNTLIKGEKSVTSNDFNHSGRNIHYGVREHAMAAIMNGMALSKLIIPFGGTFFCFTDYMKGAMRLSALMHQRVIYVLTHDSIGLGEDGPTHQPVEHLIHMRAIPNMLVIRPADANETAMAWRAALENSHGPTCLILTRQNLPVLERMQDGHSASSGPAAQSPHFAPAENVLKGAYVLTEKFVRIAPPAADSSRAEPRLTLMASGSEVALIIEAAKQLAAEGIVTRLVSFPSWELFNAQPAEYRAQVLGTLPRLAVEAGSSLGWHKYVGDTGDIIGLDRFGASAPGEVAMEKLGFSVENVVARAKALIGR
ncbi:transketolase [Candidatus Peregrinibacteria bacterium CG11_big_fil_rev_8_21_14_0_20_46_8]|nr:MAG: transketolase [Candidatus Peregrinibacteria bacterium CG11_big_fil_rev_8_21_14_0_20_46_8]